MSYWIWFKIMLQNVNYLSCIPKLELIQICRNSLVKSFSSNKIGHHLNDWSSFVVRNAIKVGQDYIWIIGDHWNRMGGLKSIWNQKQDWLITILKIVHSGLFFNWIELKIFIYMLSILTWSNLSHFSLSCFLKLLTHENTIFDKCSLITLISRSLWTFFPLTTNYS